MDAEAPLTNGAMPGGANWRRRAPRTAKTCGPDAAVLASSFCGKSRESDGGKKAVHRGEHAISRKAIAQGMSDCLRCPVCSCAHLLSIAHGTAGAARIRHSLRPLFREVAKITCKPRAYRAAGTRFRVPGGQTLADQSHVRDGKPDLELMRRAL